MSPRHAGWRRGGHGKTQEKNSVKCRMLTSPQPESGSVTS
jgi:hypothetical protein